MQTIWKFPIKAVDTQTVIVPHGATPLAVQVQAGDPCIWMIVDPEAITEAVRVETIGTGHPIEGRIRGMEHIGTYQLLAGSLVFHVFFPEASR